MGLYSLALGLQAANATLFMGTTWSRLVLLPLMLVFIGAMIFGATRLRRNPSGDGTLDLRP